MQAKAIIDQAARLLSDKGNDEWPRDDLAHALSFVLYEIARLNPRAFASGSGLARTLKLSSGYEQSVPGDVLRWIEATRNMGSDGTTPGRAIRNAVQGPAEAVAPSLGVSAPSTTVRDVYWSPSDPLRFFVYPPAPSTPDVHIEYLAVGAPPDGAAIVADETTEIPVTDDYAPVILDGVMGYALSEQTRRHEYRNPNEAQQHWNAFYQVLDASRVRQPEQ